MLPKPLLLLTLLSLTACEQASSETQRFTAVPLIGYSAAEQRLAQDRILKACGDPPACPSTAILERMAIDYGRLRAMVRATIGKEK